jgi:cytidyltransferase-like protein
VVGYELGSVHGRFQPLHNGHLEYIEAALEQCDFLFVGITQFVLHKLVQVQSQAAVHRAQPDSNPLTYFERLRIVDAVMSSIDVGRDRYSVLPFPIEEPSELHEFLPTSVPVFTTTYDAWNRDKIDTLEGCGYRVINLWTRSEKAVIGHEIRTLMRSGSEAWRDSVPKAVAHLLDDFGVAERLRKLARATDA